MRDGTWLALGRHMGGGSTPRGAAAPRHSESGGGAPQNEAGVWGAAAPQGENQCRICVCLDLRLVPEATGKSRSLTSEGRPRGFCETYKLAHAAQSWTPETAFRYIFVHVYECSVAN